MTVNDESRRRRKESEDDGWGAEGGGWGWLTVHESNIFHGLVFRYCKGHLESQVHLKFKQRKNALSRIFLGFVNQKVKLSLHLLVLKSTNNKQNLLEKGTRRERDKYKKFLRMKEGTCTYASSMWKNTRHLAY